MSMIKHRYVIKPGSIHVAQNYTFTVGSKTSPFSDCYDMFKAAQILGDKVFSELEENDPQYEEWTIFKAHELLLKQYLKKGRVRRDSLKWGEYEVLPSEDERFKELGALSSSEQDRFYLHTKQAIRLWEGNNNKKNGARWPGVRFALNLSNELLSMALTDNPYAQYQLLELEKQIDEIEQYLNEHLQNVNQQISTLAQSGLQISVIRNNNPVQISLNAVRGYGYRLVKMLMDYDRFVCAVKTLSVKGFINNATANEILYNGGRLIRRMLNELYQIMIQMRAIREIRREHVLDEHFLPKLVSATTQGVLPVLPLGIWDYSVQPSLIFIQKKVPTETLNRILLRVKEHNLVRI